MTIGERGRVVMEKLPDECKNMRCGEVISSYFRDIPLHVLGKA
jgi:hypothetical protein